MTRLPDPWPLWGLVLRTPRLELRPDDDAGLLELVEVTRGGVHPPEEMPFGVEWTDAPAEELGRNSLQFYWSQRAGCRPDAWRINFLVRLAGKVIGTQELGASNFAITREVSSGSWLGLPYQGRGYGTEMRAAVLMLAFDHLGATAARSAAFADNSRSRGVSRRLGYVEDGSAVLARRGQPARNLRLVVTAERFAEHRPDWKLDLTGLAPVLPTLGLVD